MGCVLVRRNTEEEVTRFGVTACDFLQCPSCKRKEKGFLGEERCLIIQFKVMHLSLFLSLRNTIKLSW